MSPTPIAAAVSQRRQRVLALLTDLLALADDAVAATNGCEPSSRGAMILASLRGQLRAGMTAPYGVDPDLFARAIAKARMFCDPAETITARNTLAPLLAKDCRELIEAWPSDQKRADVYG